MKIEKSLVHFLAMNRFITTWNHQKTYSFWWQQRVLEDNIGKK